MNNSPLVSVVIPLYNKRPHVVEMLNSVFAQTYSDFEVIVVNDGSTDGSEELLQEFRDRIVYFRQENAGPSAARNRGVELAKGEFVAFLDADDRWMPEKLSVQIEFLQDNREFQWVACNYYEVRQGVSRKAARRIDHSQNWTIYPNWFIANTGRYMILTSGVIARKSLIADAGGFDTTIPSGQDVDLWIRMARIDPQYAFCTTPLFDYLDVVDSVSKVSLKRFDSGTRLIEKHIDASLEAGDNHYQEFALSKAEALIRVALAHGLSDYAKRIIRRIPPEWHRTSTKIYGLIAMLPNFIPKYSSRTWRFSKKLAKRD